MSTGLWLIKRGPRPGYHNGIFHPVVICTRKHTAKWEAGDTGTGSWVWSKDNMNERCSGWLLCRWNGFDVDYGPVCHGITMPDGRIAGVDHDRNEEPWTLLNGAIWWSEHHMPKWVKNAGVLLPTDRRTIEMIRNTASWGLPAYREEQFLNTRERQIIAGKLIDWNAIIANVKEDANA